MAFKKIKKYKMRSTKELFDKYKTLGNKVIGLGEIVQIDSLIVTQKDLITWRDDIEKIITELTDLVDETIDGIEEL